MILSFNLLSPLSHSDIQLDAPESNISMFRKMPIVNLPDFPEIPVVSGVCIRRELREITMSKIFSIVTIDDFLNTFRTERIAKTAFDKVYYILANGGSISKSKRVAPDEIRQLRTKMPFLSVFGGALPDVMLSGTVSIGFAIPFCVETVKSGLWKGEAAITPPYAADLLHDLNSIHTYMPNDEDIKGMPYGKEVLSMGTTLQCEIMFNNFASELEKGCIGYALSQLQYIGGGRNRGLGRVEVKCDKMPETTMYEEYLQNRHLIKSAVLEYAESL